MELESDFLTRYVVAFQYACIDNEGEHIAVAGITGLAHFSVLLKRWKLFGNESQVAKYSLKTILYFIEEK